MELLKAMAIFIIIIAIILYGIILIGCIREASRSLKEKRNKRK